MPLSRLSQDLTRTTLALLFIGVLITACFWILLPFMSAMLWAAMIVISTWPLMLKVQTLLWGKRSLAVAFMTLLLLMMLVVPLFLSILTVVERSDTFVDWTRSLSTLAMPAPPGWVGNLPIVGTKIADSWNHLATSTPAELSTRLTPYAGAVASWIASKAGGLGMMIAQFLLTVVISAILYSTGEIAATGIRLFARRLAGQQGEEAAILAAKATRGVALGVGVTALVQALLGGIGLAVSGVPAAALLTAVMFMLCLAQVGPGPVLVPAIVWLFWQDQILWGGILIGWTIFVGTIDNFIRPFLIKKGADLPLILIFAGVLGGLFAFGIIGLFIGPVVLAVTYTLLSAWVVGNISDDEPTTDETC
ncbi:MAG TPA: AI-2E family transporter YdiK [Desulfuromonadales bacterium]|nr:AI-2E family transporter YdiK [Desulfuromonadales bacterium]